MSRGFQLEMQSIHEVPLAMPLKSAERNQRPIVMAENNPIELFTRAQPVSQPAGVAELRYIADSTEKSVAAPQLPVLAIPHS
jgi:hypothetical protein